MVKKPFVCRDEVGTDFRVGVAWMEESSGLLDCSLRDERAADCGILGKLEWGMAVNSISSDIFGKLERFEPEDIILLRLALGVAEICIP